MAEVLGGCGNAFRVILSDEEIGKLKAIILKWMIEDDIADRYRDI